MSQPNDEISPEQRAAARQLIEEMLADCMDDPDALSCAIESIAAIPDELEELKPRIVLLTAQDCIHCSDARFRYQDLLDRSQVQEVDVESLDGTAIVLATNLDHTPALLVLTPENQLVGELVDPAVVEGEEIITNEKPGY